MRAKRSACGLAGRSCGQGTPATWNWGKKAGSGELSAFRKPAHRSFISPGDDVYTKFLTRPRPNCRPFPRAPALVGVGTPPVSQRHQTPQPVDRLASEALAR